MLRIVRTISLPGELFHNFVNTLVIPRIVSAPWIVRVCPAYEERIIGHFGKNSDIVVAVIHTFPFDKAELSVPRSGVPSNPKICVFCQVTQTDIVNHVSRPDK